VSFTTPWDVQFIARAVIIGGFGRSYDRGCWRRALVIPLPKHPVIAVSKSRGRSSEFSTSNCHSDRKGDTIFVVRQIFRIHRLLEKFSRDFFLQKFSFLQAIDRLDNFYDKCNITLTSRTSVYTFPRHFSSDSSKDKFFATQSVFKFPTNQRKGIDAFVCARRSLTKNFILIRAREWRWGNRVINSRWVNSGATCEYYLPTSAWRVMIIVPVFWYRPSEIFATIRLRFFFHTTNTRLISFLFSSSSPRLRFFYPLMTSRVDFAIESEVSEYIVCDRLL